VTDSDDSTTYRARALSGGRWGAMRGVVIQLVGLLTTAALTRILSDVDYGLVAIAVVVLALFDLITAVGFGASIVRTGDLQEGLVASYFWGSILLGGAAGGLAGLLSTPAASLAGAVEAAPLIAVGALTLPLSLATAVPVGLLSRRLKFRSLAFIDIASMLTHAAVAIPLAALGFGPWAVVVGYVVRAGARLGMAMFAAKFFPRPRLRLLELKKDLGFNLSFFATDAVAYANKNADYWFVGNVLGAALLGSYYVAYVIPTLLRRRVTGVAHDVLYPIISKFQDDTERIISAYLKVTRLVAFILLPALLGLSVTADLAVRIGFGQGWDDSITPLALISIAAAVAALGVPAVPIFPAVGRPLQLVTIGGVSLLILLLTLLATTGFTSLVVVAWCVIAAAVTELVVLQTRLKTILGMSPSRWLGAIAPFGVSAIVMAVVVVGARAWVFAGLPMAIEALAAVTVGLGVYLAMGRLGYRIHFRDQLEAARALIKR